MLFLMICQTKHKRKSKCSPNLFRLLSRKSVGPISEGFFDGLYLCASISPYSSPTIHEGKSKPSVANRRWSNYNGWAYNQTCDTRRD